MTDLQTTLLRAAIRALFVMIAAIWIGYVLRDCITTMYPLGVPCGESVYTYCIVHEGDAPLFEAQVRLARAMLDAALVAGSVFLLIKAFSNWDVVPGAGIEPTALSLQVRRSTD